MSETAVERQRTILIIEDDSQLANLLAGFFSRDYRTLQADNGADALMLAVDQKPELMLLDINLPLVDGRTLCRKLKNYPATKDIKVVMITGRSSQNDRLVGFDVGADDYIEKPFTLEYARRSVENLLR